MNVIDYSFSYYGMTLVKKAHTTLKASASGIGKIKSILLSEKTFK